MRVDRLLKPSLRHRRGNLFCRLAFNEILNEADEDRSSASDLFVFRGQRLRSRKFADRLVVCVGPQELCVCVFMER